jgi:hypothetical protein
VGKTPLAHLNWDGYISPSDVQEVSLFAVCARRILFGISAYTSLLFLVVGIGGLKLFVTVS